MHWPCHTGNRLSEDVLSSARHRTGFTMRWCGVMLTWLPDVQAVAYGILLAKLDFRCGLSFSSVLGHLLPVFSQQKETLCKTVRV